MWSATATAQSCTVASFPQVNEGCHGPWEQACPVTVTPVTPVPHSEVPEAYRPLIFSNGQQAKPPYVER